MAVEELDPVLEQELLLLSGRHHLPPGVKGKFTGEVQTAGENSVESVRRVLEEYLGRSLIRYLEGLEGGAAEPEAAPAGSAAASASAGTLCRMSPPGIFYAVKRAMEKLNEGLGEGRGAHRGEFTAAISAAILWAMQSLWIWWTPACAWAPDYHGPGAAAGGAGQTVFFLCGRFHLLCLRSSQVLSMRYTMRPA